jgi:hypothetical protein
MEDAMPEAAAAEARVRAAFRDQAAWCAKLGSPFTALVCATLAAHLDRSTAVGRRVLDWSGARPDAGGDSVPLRFAGGLNGLVRAGRLPELAKLYPPAPLPDAATFARTLAAALADADADLLPWLDGPPQTNEVGRSVHVFAGLSQLAAETNCRFALYELGASAGLNLASDRYAYRLADADYGALDSALVFRPAWEGGAPPVAPVVVVERQGCDVNPLDIADPAARARLAAYIWPDQSERLARFFAAADIAAAAGIRVVRADAGAWLEEMLPLAGAPGILRVVFHTVARQYFPPATTARLDAHLARAAARATATTPLAALGFEFDPATGRHTLALTLWPGGERRLLATGDAHGRTVRWLAPQASP